jgi:hypothetical protein
LVYEGLAHEPEKLPDFSDKIMRKTRVGVLALPLQKYKPFRILFLLAGRATRLCCGVRRQ